MSASLVLGIEREREDDQRLRVTDKNTRLPPWGVIQGLILYNFHC